MLSNNFFQEFLGSVGMAFLWLVLVLIWRTLFSYSQTVWKKPSLHFVCFSLMSQCIPFPLKLQISSLILWKLLCSLLYQTYFRLVFWQSFGLRIFLLQSSNFQYQRMTFYLRYQRLTKALEHLCNMQQW